MKSRRPTCSSLLSASLICGLAQVASTIAADLKVPDDFPTIQAAVDAAQSKDSIHIAPGVYVEQITILRKTLTLLGSPGTVIRAQTGLTTTLAAYDFCSVPVLGVALSDVTIKGITFEGEHLAGSYQCRLAGIIYSGSSGRIEHCSFSGFREEQLGNFSGFGIVVGNNTTLGTAPVSVQILQSTFCDNAGSILVKGADAAGERLRQRLSFTIEGNTIRGVGPTTNGTQVGIWISPGASGEVSHNIISDHAYTGSTPQFSDGILAADWQWLQFGQPTAADLLAVTYKNNTFSNNQEHLVTLHDNGSRIVGNKFGNTVGYRSTGVSITGRNVMLGTNTFSDMPVGVRLLGDDPDFPKGALGIAADSSVIDNRFCNVATPVQVEPLAVRNIEQGTLTCPFPAPTLSSTAAILLSWPADTEGWIETATNADGPWIRSDATPFPQASRQNVALPSDGHQQFFRLRTE